MTPLRFGRLHAWLLVALVSAQCAGSSGSLSPAAAELQRDEASFLARAGGFWVTAERHRHRPRGTALSTEEKQRMGGFFTTEVLESARIRVVDAIEDPPFYSAYEELGREVPLRFSGAVGLALVDTILLRRSHAGPGTDARHSVLFHELVHLEQYRILGAETYVERYVSAFAENGFEYRANPFEAQAFELQNRYRNQPDRTFVVADEVRRRFVTSTANPRR